MTDLERAQSELLDIVACAYQGMWTQPLIARVTEILAAARREGAEEERAKQGEAGALIRRAAELVRTQKSGAYSEARRAAQREGAEEMRERVARHIEEMPIAYASGIAHAIRALPLTPEEPR